MRQRAMVRLRCRRGELTAAVLSLALVLGACPGQSVTTCDEDGTCDSNEDQGPPRIDVRPVFGLGFDCVAIGCNQARDVTISNRGGGILTVTSARLTAGTSTDFSLQATVTPPVDLGPGQETSLTVALRPSDAQDDNGVLRIVTAALPPEDAIAGQVELPLRARQNGDPVIDLSHIDAEGEVEPVPLEGGLINFGYVAGGTIGRRELVVRNLTLGSAILELFEIAQGENFESAFYVTPLESGDRWINPGDEVRIELQLLAGSTPADLRLYDTEILVRTNDPVWPEVPVRLFGTAKNVPVIEVSPAEVDLGAVRIGGSPSVLLTVSNEGGADLLATPLLLAGANVGFMVEGDATPLAAVAAFGETTIAVRLEAGVGGEATGLLRVESNDPLAPAVDVPLRAFVEAPLLAVSPDPIAFGAVVQTWTAAPIAAQIINAGPGLLEITGVELGAGSSSQFRLISPPSLPTTLEVGAPAIEVAVSYVATTIGPAVGQLVLHSNSIDGARAEVPISGTGVACEQGCAMPHAQPSCTHGVCEVWQCDAGFHDADQQGANGCECDEESPEVGSFCSVAAVVGNLEDDDVTVTGTLHDADDVDVYWFHAVDSTDFCLPFTDDGDIDVALTSAPEGVELCVSYIDHQPSDDGCGLGTETCGLRDWEFDDTTCGSDDGRDVTVRVRFAPEQAPMCAEYSLELDSSI